MSFYPEIQKVKNTDIRNSFLEVTDTNIRTALRRDPLNPNEYFALLSPRAENHLEEIARKAHTVTKQYFGKTIQLYTPIYIANYCENRCSYCSFNADNKIVRKKLTFDEIERKVSDKFMELEKRVHEKILELNSKLELILNYLELLKDSKKMSFL